MILHGNQRAGGMQLAKHLLNDKDNEHVTVHEISGFVSDTVAGALNEAYAVSRGTKCKQFLFSLSLNPPPGQNVPVEYFEKQISEAENKLGLAGQPRVICFHEKHGRRHAHCVWSRIIVDKMKAVNLSHTHRKLREISREIFLEKGWQMPVGLVNSEERNPLNFTHAEYQQAARAKISPKIIKEIFRDCWAISDGRKAFAKALGERGYYLASGKRGFVAVDWQGETYAVSRMVGVRAKEIKAKLGDTQELPSVEQTQAHFAEKFTLKLQEFADAALSRHRSATEKMDAKRQALVSRQRGVRLEQSNVHETRWVEETKTRSLRLPRGLKALWFRVTGQYKKIKMKNEREAAQSKARNQSEKHKLIEKQLVESQRLNHEIEQLRHSHVITMRKLNRDIADYLKLTPTEQVQRAERDLNPAVRRKRRRSRSLES